MSGRTDDYGKDTQRLQRFIDKDAVGMQEKHLGTTYVIRYKRKPIGYITLSTSSIHKNHIFKKARPRSRDGSFFPAVIIQEFCIDKPSRRCGFGEYVLLWCSGLARKIAKQIGCRYIVLFTKEAKEFYLQPDFQEAEIIEDGNKYTMMYADIFPELQNTIR